MMNNKNVLGKMLTGDDLFMEYKNSPEIEWLIEGVLTCNSLNILAAASNVGKSFLILDLVKALCSEDEKFMGLFNVKNNSKVMFIDGEDTSLNIGRRLFMLGCYDKGSTFKSSNLLYPKNSIVRLNHLESLLELADYCNQNNVDLVVFDSFAVYCGGDESSNSQMALVSQNLSIFRSRCKSAVILLNHIRKTMGGTSNAKNPITLNDIRGASAIGAMVDSAFGIQKFNGYCRLRTIKSRQLSTQNWLDRCYVLDNNGLEETHKNYRCFYEMLEDQNNDDDFIKSKIIEFVSKYSGCSTSDIVNHIKGKTQRVVDLLKELLAEDNPIIEMKKLGKKNVYSVIESEGE